MPDMDGSARTADTTCYGLGLHGQIMSGRTVVVCMSNAAVADEKSKNNAG